MNDLIDIIKVGGPATAISGLFLWYFDRLDKRTKALIENHLTHLTDVMNRNTVVLERLSVLIERLLKKSNLRSRV
jgi:uncharacterized protein YigA (DUF484 family)